jgi:hypothetical protein
MNSVDQTVSVCPYIDRADMRCASRLTVLNLRETFQFCFGQPQSCAVYRQICLEESRRNAAVVIAQTA